MRLVKPSRFSPTRCSLLRVMWKAMLELRYKVHLNRRARASREFHSLRASDSPKVCDPLKSR